MRCCHWSLSSFLLTTGVSHSDVLYAHLDSSPIYYLTVDHYQKCVVICCRGTLSIADAVIDLDAALASLDSLGYRGEYTHQGILLNALKLHQDLNERGVLESFMHEKPHYNIMVVGHSLGAATATLLTLLLREKWDRPAMYENTEGRLNSTTRNKLTCIAYGCPLLLSFNLAQSEFCLRCITTIVYNNDIISRLSLSNCSLLKDQMINSFAKCENSKFKILANSIRKDYHASFQRGEDLETGGAEGDMQQQQAHHSSVGRMHPSFLSPDPIIPSSSPPEGNPGAPGGDISSQMTMLGTVAQALDSIDALPKPTEEGKEAVEEKDVAKGADEQHSSPAPPAVGVSSSNGSLPRQGLDGGVSSSIPAVLSHTRMAPSDVSNASATAAAASSPFTLHLRKCYLPGRIYHVLPGNPSPPAAPSGFSWPGSSRRRRMRRSVVYPASQQTFQEIVVGKSMFADHMPRCYALKHLTVPHVFFEPTERDDDPASPSPVAPHTRNTEEVTAQIRQEQLRKDEQESRV